uniref:Uncharacterized protein n=1 Tax=Romanomermis culicivorax TaxID=13658 RepID=A0A915JK30_ROMCU
MYELYDPCTTMFFFRNKHIMIDLGMLGCKEAALLKTDHKALLKISQP